MLNSACELYGWNASNITHVRDSGINSGHVNGKSDIFLFNAYS